MKTELIEIFLYFYLFFFTTFDIRAKYQNLLIWGVKGWKILKYFKSNSDCKTYQFFSFNQIPNFLSVALRFADKQYFCISQ